MARPASQEEARCGGVGRGGAVMRCACVKRPSEGRDRPAEAQEEGEGGGGATEYDGELIMTLVGAKETLSGMTPSKWRKEEAKWERHPANKCAAMMRGKKPNRKWNPSARVFVNKRTTPEGVLREEFKGKPPSSRALKKGHQYDGERMETDVTPEAGRDFRFQTVDDRPLSFPVMEADRVTVEVWDGMLRRKPKGGSLVLAVSKVARNFEAGQTKSAWYALRDSNGEALGEVRIDSKFKPSQRWLEASYPSYGMLDDIKFSIPGAEGGVEGVEGEGRRAGIPVPTRTVNGNNTPSFTVEVPDGGPLGITCTPREGCASLRVNGQLCEFGAEAVVDVAALEGDSFPVAVTSDKGKETVYAIHVVIPREAEETAVAEEEGDRGEATAGEAESILEEKLRRDPLQDELEPLKSPSEDKGGKRCTVM